MPLFKLVALLLLVVAKAAAPQPPATIGGPVTARAPTAGAATSTDTAPKTAAPVDTKTAAPVDTKTAAPVDTKTELKTVAGMPVLGEHPEGPEDVALALARASGWSRDVLPAKRYAGHVVLRARPTTAVQRDALAALFRSGELDIWKSFAVDEDVQFRVSPDAFNWTTSYLEEEGISHEPAIEDVQGLIDSENPSDRMAMPSDGPFGWDKYHRLSDIYQWMASLVKRYPTVATLVRGGRSSEGRGILGVRVAFGADLPVVHLEGGIHGREWVSPAAATYILSQLLTSADPTVVRAARSFEWHVFPSVNPDAYEYTHTTDRLWRKSLKRNSFRCYGADLNRNYPFSWGSVGVSWDYCSDLFPGTRAASEVETRTRIAYLEPLLARTKAYIALHSFGQYLLMPWGNTIDRPAGFESMMAVAAKSADAFARRYGSRLKVGPTAETLYPTSGSSMDWAHSRGVPFAYTFELRDTGRFGFLLPADQIVPASQEALDGVAALLGAVLDQRPSK